LARTTRTGADTARGCLDGAGLVFFLRTAIVSNRSIATRHFQHTALWIRKPPEAK
jgi:hypothetical protein